MMIQINGEPRDVADGVTVTELLAHLGIPSRTCAVEVNGAVISRSDHSQQILQRDDELEIVTLVGGG